MKKNILMMATVCMLAAPLSAGAYMVDGTRVDLLSHEGKSGGAWVEITGDGTEQVTFNLGLADGTIADMRGFFFNVNGYEDIETIRVNSLVDANNDFVKNNVITNWPNVSGSAGMQGAGNFEIGVEFGAGGIGNKKGDINAISFTVFSDDILDIDESNLGMRLMSFGDGRNDSRKMIGGYEPSDSGPGPGPASVPEPASALMIGLGLAGLAGFRKRNQRQK
jgi:hypothetical protein